MIFRFLLITLASTAAMTLFSYCLSVIIHQNLIEPYWLNRLLFKKEGWKSTYGWLTHYITGIGFLYLLEPLSQFFTLPLYLEILVYGGLEGALGILMWMLLFRLTHRPKDINPATYYLNLIGAHIVFVTSALLFLE